MNVGYIPAFGARFPAYWEALLRELGVEVLTPQLDAAQAYALGQESLPGEPPHIQLVLGRILEQQRADLLLLPPLLAVGNAGGNDPWGEALTELLPRRFSGLPTLETVPDGGDMTGAAADLAQRLTRTPARVRLALDRVRPLGLPLREAMPALSAPSRQTVAVIGPRSLLAEPYLSGELRSELTRLGLHAVYASDLPHEGLAARGERLGPGPAGLLELQGAQVQLEGKSAVRALVYAVPDNDPAHHLVLSRLSEKARKPHALVRVAPDGSDLSALARLRDRLSGAPSSEAELSSAATGEGWTSAGSDE